MDQFLPKPDPKDCCNSGCNPCILDVYEDLLKKYQKNNNNERLQQTLKENCIKPTKYSTFLLYKRENLSNNADLLTFKYLNSQTPYDKYLIDFNPGQYFILKNNEYTRPYTPIFKENCQFTILIKYYKNGLMSNYLKNLNINDKTLWRGPYGTFPIIKSKYLLCIAQGVGIAPIFTIIQSILNDENAEIFIKLFYCCKSSNEIYLRNYLYEFQHYWNFDYEIFLSHHQDLNKKYNEIIREEKLNINDIKNHLLDKKQYTMILVCGSETFQNDIKNKLISIGVEKENIFLF